MKHKYDIQNLLLSAVGYKGLPYPGAFFPNRATGGYRGDDYRIDSPSSSYEGPAYEITTSPAPRQEFVRGTRLYKQDANGRWYFMPVFVRHAELLGDDHTLELENAVISITGAKNIVRTPLVGRRGSVKELVSVGDYKISIAAFIHSSDGSYPQAQIARMKELYNINEAVELISALTDLILDEGDRIVITDIQYPSTPGLEDGQVVTLECETDSAFELNIG